MALDSAPLPLAPNPNHSLSQQAKQQLSSELACRPVQPHLFLRSRLVQVQIRINSQAQVDAAAQDVEGPTKCSSCSWCVRIQILKTFCRWNSSLVLKMLVRCPRGCRQEARQRIEQMQQALEATLTLLLVFCHHTSMV